MNAEGRWLAESWAEHLGPAISAMTGSDARTRCADSSAAPPAPVGDLLWSQTLDTVPPSVLWLSVSEAVWKDVGQQTLTAAGIENAQEDEIRATFEEILQQSLSGLVSAIGSRIHREIQAGSGALQSTQPENLEWHAVEVIGRHGVLGKAWLAADSTLLAALEPPSADDSSDLNAAGGPARRPSPTLELLMEVELPVGVSFGRAQMRLKDAVKLTTGSIVELNRSVSEPVEVLVNNCVIARGEVVVIDGNYGVRIKQIISREERLRTLF
jgi:flagellar motor switch protein FliN/FliY